MSVILNSVISLPICQRMLHLAWEQRFLWRTVILNSRFYSLFILQTRFSFILLCHLTVSSLSSFPTFSFSLQALRTHLPQRLFFLFRLFCFIMHFFSFIIESLFLSHLLLPPLAIIIFQYLNEHISVCLLEKGN